MEIVVTSMEAVETSFLTSPCTSFVEVAKSFVEVEEASKEVVEPFMEPHICFHEQQRVRKTEGPTVVLSNVELRTEYIENGFVAAQQPWSVANRFVLWDMVV